MAELWLAGHLIDTLTLEQARKDELARMISESTAYYQKGQFLPGPFDLKISRMFRMIDAGDSEAAGELARELATEAYNDHLDRKLCGVTDNVFFHKCFHWDD